MSDLHPIVQSIKNNADKFKECLNIRMKETKHPWWEKSFELALNDLIKILNEFNIENDKKFPNILNCWKCDLLVARSEEKIYIEIKRFRSPAACSLIDNTNINEWQGEFKDFSRNIFIDIGKTIVGNSLNIKVLSLIAPVGALSFVFNSLKLPRIYGKSFLTNLCFINSGFLTVFDWEVSLLIP